MNNPTVPRHTDAPPLRICECMRDGLYDDSTTCPECRGEGVAPWTL